MPRCPSDIFRIPDLSGSNDGIARGGINGGRAARMHVLRNKEVVVNAPTLICQEFCRTRRQGETTEETAGGAALSCNPVHQGSARYTDDAHTCAQAGQHVQRFLARVDVLPKLPNRVAARSGPNTRAEIRVTFVPH